MAPESTIQIAGTQVVGGEWKLYNRIIGMPVYGVWSNMEERTRLYNLGDIVSLISGRPFVVPITILYN